ncbi:hypothetical protein CC80DRAFT_493367 [Byssothecium circinans]|uniref:Uncharacterized protein n=1 Tax=Byssothecium circinans TaxID=147558 RepID=A0A6A5TTJ0_9PLEO|nr:hypothetical protein CC80DRAFT_493367 [Byssothecium circinans]
MAPTHSHGRGACLPCGGRWPCVRNQISFDYRPRASTPVRAICTEAAFCTTSLILAFLISHMVVCPQLQPTADYLLRAPVEASNSSSNPSIPQSHRPISATGPSSIAMQSTECDGEGFSESQCTLEQDQGPANTVAPGADHFIRGARTV